MESQLTRASVELPGKTIARLRRCCTFFQVGSSPQLAGKVADIPIPSRIPGITTAKLKEMTGTLEGIVSW